MRYGLKWPDGSVTDILRAPHISIPEGAEQVQFARYPQGHSVGDPLISTPEGVVADEQTKAARQRTAELLDGAREEVLRDTLDKMAKDPARRGDKADIEALLQRRGGGG